jgi:hypothetical protein
VAAVLSALIQPTIASAFAPRCSSSKMLVAQQQLARRQQQIERVIEQQNLPVRHLFNAPLFEGPVFCTSPQREFVVMNAAEDPVWSHQTGFPVRKQALAQLRSIEQCRLPIDAVYVVHEVPNGTALPGKTLTTETLTPPPREVVQLSHNLGVTAQGLWTLAATPLLVSAALLAASAVGAVLASGGIAAAMMAVPAVAALDPIVLGVAIGEGQPVKPGTPAAWYYLAHWEY